MHVDIPSWSFPTDNALPPLKPGGPFQRFVVEIAVRFWEYVGGKKRIGDKNTDTTPWAELMDKVH